MAGLLDMVGGFGGGKIGGYSGTTGNGGLGLLADWLLGFRGKDYMAGQRAEEEYRTQKERETLAQKMLRGNEQFNPVEMTAPNPGLGIAPTPGMNYSPAATANKGPAMSGTPGLLSRVDPTMRPFLEGMAAVDPMGALKAAMPKPGEYSTDVKFDAQGRGYVMDKNSGTPKFIDAVTPERDPNKPFYMAPGGPQANTDFQKYDFTKATLTRPQTFITNDQRREGAYSTARGGQFAKLAADMDTRAQNAADGLSTMAEMSRVLSAPGVYQGSNEEAINAAKKFASTVLGMNIDGVAEADVAKSIGNQLALDIKKDTKDPQMSASELVFYQRIPPNLGNSPGGNQLLIEIRNRKYQRDLAIAKMAREYEDKHGQLDAGFVEQRAQFMQKNPVNTPEMEQRLSAMKPTSSADPEIDALLKKYGQ